MRSSWRKSFGSYSEAINKLIAARLAADVCGVPTVLVGTDADAADLLTSDIDERDKICNW